jgi:hypothetical protein
MIENSKQKIAELGGAAGDIAKGVAGLGVAKLIGKPAAVVDMQANVAKAIPKIGLGAVGAITGMEPPRTPDYNMSYSDKVMNLANNSISNVKKGADVIGANIKQGAGYLGGVAREGLKGVGFTEPVSALPTALTASPAISTSAPAPALGTVAPVVSQKTAPPSINAVSRPEGDPDFFKGGAKFEGNSLSSTGTGVGMSEKDLADWKARGDLQNSSYYDGKNPNDDKFTGMMKELMDVSGASPSAETSNKIKSLRLGIQALAPMTSYGQFGVAGLQTDTTKRGQDITAETARRTQDISAKIHGDQLLLDTFYKTGLLEQGKEELGIKKLQAEAKDLPGYLKMVTAMSPKIKTTDPITGAETESHDVAKGVELLTQAGFATPKGFKAPEANKAPSLDEFFATAAKNKSKMTKEQLTQYYNEKYGKGR